MATTPSPTPDLSIEPVAVYQRMVRASEARVWENVLDWEHLPWLHHGAFASIHCEHSGSWGWRARVGMAPGGDHEIEIELLVDRDARRYVTRTLDGAGAGTEIWTALVPRGDEATGIIVRFLVPDLDVAQRDAVGRGYVGLYTKLWDEDETMMRERQRVLDTRALARPPAGREPVSLGCATTLRERAPCTVDAHGCRYRVVEHGGTLHAHTAICPHLGGPLGDGRIEGPDVVCPWHGYRFDLTDGREQGGRPCRLLDRPELRVDSETDRATLVFPA